MTINIEQIKQIKLPSNVEMNDMPIEQLTEWRDILKPHYENRLEYRKQDYGLYFKAARYLAFERMIENLQNDLPRWHKISNEPF